MNTPAIITPTKITIKPAKSGVKVSKPDGNKLAIEGETVIRNAFWVRRLKDGDVVLVESTTAKSTTAAKTAANKGE